MDKVRYPEPLKFDEKAPGSGRVTAKPGALLGVLAAREARFAGRICRAATTVAASMTVKSLMRR